MFAIIDLLTKVRWTKCTQKIGILTPMIKVQFQVPNDWSDWKGTYDMLMNVRQQFWSFCKISEKKTSFVLQYAYILGK